MRKDALQHRLKLVGNGPVEGECYCIGKTRIRVGVLMVFDLSNKLIENRVDKDDKFLKIFQLS